MRGIEGKVAVVTGGGGGIGRAIARRLATHGGRIGVLDKSVGAAEETVALAIGDGGAAHAVTVDLTEYDAVKGAIDSVEDALGPVDILINNVGWDRTAQFLDTDPALWDQLIAINLRTHLNVCHVVLSRMVARGATGGKVVNIASDAGRIGSSNEAVYSACKGGLIAFGKTLAREMARHRICVNSVCPGPTETPLLEQIRAQGEREAKLVDKLAAAIPFRRLGQPDDLTGMVAFLASADADFITGQVISVSGGLTMHG